LSAKIGRTFDSARGFHLCFRLQIRGVHWGNIYHPSV